MQSRPDGCSATTSPKLGTVLADEAEGRRYDEATLLDSTGLAVQDIAVALAAMERTDE